MKKWKRVEYLINQMKADLKKVCGETTTTTTTATIINYINDSNTNNNKSSRKTKQKQKPKNDFHLLFRFEVI